MSNYPLPDPHILNDTQQLPHANQRTDSLPFITPYLESCSLIIPHFFHINTTLSEMPHARPTVYIMQCYTSIPSCRPRPLSIYNPQSLEAPRPQRTIYDIDLSYCPLLYSQIPSQPSGPLTIIIRPIYLPIIWLSSVYWNTHDVQIKHR